MELSCLQLTELNLLSFSDLDLLFPHDNVDKTQVLSVTPEAQFADTVGRGLPWHLGGSAFLDDQSQRKVGCHVFHLLPFLIPSLLSISESCPIFL